MLFLSINMEGKKHHRRSIRLLQVDYNTPGFYFITLCAYQRELLFGQIENGEMKLNENGKVVDEWWQKIEIRYPGVFLDAFVIMPNHIHGIVLITDNATVGAIHELPLQLDETSPDTWAKRRKMLLPKIIGYFKMNSAKAINKMRDLERVPVWQRNYYEHIVRNQDSLNRIRQYIRDNPINWYTDPDNPIYAQI